MDYKAKYLKYKCKYHSLKKKIEKSKCCKKVQKGGGAVSYCYLCGGPIFNEGMFTLKNLNKYRKYSNKLVNIEHASNIVEEIEDMENIPDEIKKEIVNNVIYLNDEKYKWMNDLLILHWSGMILKISDYSNWDHDFTDSKGIEHFFSGNNFIVHKDCYEITKQKYGDYNSLYMEEYNPINYGFIKNYNTQEYNWLKYFYNNVDYVLESPLKNSKNKKRILNINHKVSKQIIPKFIDFLSAYKKNNKIPEKGYKWMKEIISYTYGGNIENYMEYFEKIINKSLLDKNKERPSPSESATKFKVGSKKKGNDGNMWIVVENKNGVKRWSKLKN